MKKRSYNIDMLQGALGPQILLFSIPLMLSELFQLSFNAVDIMVVGKLAGSESLAAVTAVTPFTTLLLNTFLGFAVGLNILIAHYIGSGDEEKLEKAVCVGGLLTLITGIFFALTGMLMTEQIVDWLKVDISIHSLSVRYLRIYLFGTPHCCSLIMEQQYSAPGEIPEDRYYTLLVPGSLIL